MNQIIYSNIRLARLFNGLSLADLGEKLDKSKQYLSRIETGAEPVSASLEQALGRASWASLPEFLRHVDPMPLTEEQCHFRKQLTTKVALRQYARARGEMLKRLVCVLDDYLDLPGVPHRGSRAVVGRSHRARRGEVPCRVGLGMGTD
jgi:transcriptional regulator with XRE-family HTH domain